MEEGKIDPNLDAPQEANTTKHINFLEREEEGQREEVANTEEDSPTKKKWEELRKQEKEAEKKSE